MIEKRSIKCLLVDLDDTLLENSWKVFPAFIVNACKALRPECGSFRAFGAMRALKNAMKASSDTHLNHDRFMKAFGKKARLTSERCHYVFDEILPEILDKCRQHFKPIHPAQSFLQLMQSEMPIVLATNPVFTEACTNIRIEWAGFHQTDFKFVTHSQNMHHCKPSTGYYQEILTRLHKDGISKEQCLFIGNDAKNDGAAVHSGIATILVSPREQISDLAIVRKGNSERATLYSGSWHAISKQFSLA